MYLYFVIKFRHFCADFRFMHLNFIGAQIHTSHSGYEDTFDCGNDLEEVFRIDANENVESSSLLQTEIPSTNMY